MSMNISGNVQQMNIVHVLDKNKDGQLQVDQEIKITPEKLAIIDENKDKSLSTDELTNAIKQDFVTIHYTTNHPAIINLNPEKFKAYSNDKSRGIIYGGTLLGAGAGAGIGALIAMAAGISPSSGAQVGALIGTLTGAVGSGIYSYTSHHPETVYKPIDPTQEPDPAVVKKHTLIGAGVGAGLGAAAGFFGLSRTGLLSPATGIFAGATMGATMGMFVGNAIAVSKSK